MDDSSIRVISIVIQLFIVAVYCLSRVIKQAACTEHTSGTVIKIDYSPHSYYIRFVYTVNGQRYEGRTNISGQQVKRFEPGMTIYLQYRPSKPEMYYVRDPYYL